MTLDLALRWTEILLGWALLLQSAEYLAVRSDGKALLLLRLGASLALMFGVGTGLALGVLCAINLSLLTRFAGPYNGGSDRMGTLVLSMLTIAQLAPSDRVSELALGYLGFQLVLSYVISGWVKIVNPEWRRGRALRDVFEFSVYPVSRSLRGWADWPGLMLGMSWAVMLFELFFPVAMLSAQMLAAGLVVAGAFHLANAALFGLNRFFWVWVSAYPSIIWLQDRLL